MCVVHIFNLCIEDVEMAKTKKTTIKFRLGKLQKEKWKQTCNSQNISLTSLIINSVENRLLDNERRDIRLFIEKQDNIFLKIENNINQFAKYANVKKNIDSNDLVAFSNALKTISELKAEQNKMFEKIYRLIAKSKNGN